MRVHAKTIHQISSWPNFSLFGCALAPPPGLRDLNHCNWPQGNGWPFLCIIFGLMIASSASKELMKAVFHG
jgi:hypothetical protein